MHFATRAIHSAQPSDPLTGALIAPIYQTSTFEQESPGVNLGFDYSRTNNPTRQRLEDVIAELEGVTHCAVFASGLAAEHAVLHAYLRPHDEVVVPRDVYGGTFRLLTRVFSSFDLKITPVDTTDLDAVASAITERTRLIWIESPTNPRLIVSDIPAIAALAHDRGALVVVDNTFATPVFQQPFALGADIVVHSVTKYLAGHSDLIQGAALAKDAAIFEPIKFLQNAIGAVPAPLDCWLTLRGIKTLELRMQRHADNASRIAIALAGQPAVRCVYYPGFGGMVSFELDGTIDDVTSFVSHRRFFALGESLGGVKSLICHPAFMTHASIPAQQRAALGLSDTLIRLSPGIEHADDLITDLIEGLHALNTRRSLVVAE
jgi:cystathionine beta-lyase/cystathionine gamma-synthase